MICLPLSIKVHDFHSFSPTKSSSFCCLSKLEEPEVIFEFDDATAVKVIYPLFGQAS